MHRFVLGFFALFFFFFRKLVGKQKNVTQLVGRSELSDMNLVGLRSHINAHIFIHLSLVAVWSGFR